MNKQSMHLKFIHFLLLLLFSALSTSVMGITCEDTKAVYCPPDPVIGINPGGGSGGTETFPYKPGKVTFVHTDALGTPVASSDDTGQPIWTEHYWPYGEKRDMAAESASLPIGFTGHRSDDATGLTYMQARYYDPIAGRFMGVDPQGFSEGNVFSFNRYAYANNNPYKYVDPDGELPILIPIIVFLAKEIAIETASSITGLPLDMVSAKGLAKRGAKYLGTKALPAPKALNAPRLPAPGAQGSDDVLRVVEPGKPQFQLRQGEEGLSVFDSKKVSENDVLPNFRAGSQTVKRSVEDIHACGLSVVCTSGDPALPKKLQDAHMEIRPGEGMTRKQFKKALKQLEP